MVSLLVTLLVAILVAGVLIYAVDLIGLDGRLAGFAKLVIIVLVAIVVIQRLGYLG